MSNHDFYVICLAFGATAALVNLVMLAHDGEPVFAIGLMFGLIAVGMSLSGLGVL